MTIRNLDHVFNPGSIALIGASKRPGSIGAVLAENMFRAGFKGSILPVHPKHPEIHGVKAYPDVASLPVAPDLGIIATPPDTVPGLVAELGARGAKGAVVITAGFGEGGHDHGLKLRDDMLKAARPHLLRVVGPNCLGIMVPGVGVNASFAATPPLDGQIAFVTQSGAIVAAVLDWASSRGLGFSHMVSLGDMSDVDFGDMLDYLANDPETKSILLYIEAVTHARKFMSAARAASRMKPVIVIKAGRFAEGAKAAASHTGALAGSDVVYDAAFRRAGMLRVFSLEELFDAVETLSSGIPPKGERLVIATNGGGIGVLATDALIEQGGTLAELSAETMARLNDCLPPTWSHGNPVDIIGDANAQRYADTVEALFADPNIDAALILNCPTAIGSQTDAARAVADQVRPGQRVSVLTSWVGGDGARDGRAIFAKRRIPTYDTPTRAVRGFMHLVNFRRNQAMLTETPPSIPEAFTPDSGRVREIVGAAVAAGQDWLSSQDVYDILDAYRIPAAVVRTARSPQQAAMIAEELGDGIALKILSPDIPHKSDVGGVMLNLEGPDAVRKAAQGMEARIAAKKPDARIDGFTLQPMIRRPMAHELIVGMAEDPQFGPTILVGQGGTAVEVVGDTALGLPPINMRLAREMIARTRISKLLRGYRDRPAADIDAIALTMIKISQLVIDFAEIKELDINPLLADEDGVIALDARIRVAAVEGVPEARLAIRPYPADLEEEIRVGDGRALMLRPVVPEDEPAIQDTFAKLTPEEVRMRFFVPIKALSHVQAARFTQIDYDREMALVLTEPGIRGTTEIFGVVRISADPDNERAEYAIIVRKEMTGMGLGHLMMRRIVDYARRRGIRQIFGDVLRENLTMLKMCDTLGFVQETSPDEPGIVRVTLTL